MHPQVLIVGGIEATPNSHPWIVSMQYFGSHFCAASLIRSSNASEETDIIVTAAHCLLVADGVKGVSIVAGVHNLTSPNSLWQTVNISSFEVHENYSTLSYDYDIGIAKLQNPIKFNSVIQPVCLPYDQESIVNGTEGIVAGWGDTSEFGSLSNTLQQVTVPIVEPSECVRVYDDVGVFINNMSMICAGLEEGGKDSCQGDSGGPFVFKENNTYTLQGIVSFGVGCARPGYPGVYTRVANYIDWINEKLSAYGTAAD